MLLGVCVVLFAGCPIDKVVVISGETMGTTYQIKIVAPFYKRLSDLTPRITQRLSDINQSMSTYISDSEISRFNSLDRAEKFNVSVDFLNVAEAAAAIYRDTEGAWDGTVKPLVNLWGFGQADNPKRVPSQSEIQKKLHRVGFGFIEISSTGYLIKRKPGISLDFSSIAKGYAVDQVAAVIRDQGLDRFLVEIGGEVYGAGHRKDNKPWQVGINRPEKNMPLDEVYKVVTLRDKALATSGDYRNFFEIDGKHYSHIIDPRTGSPVSNGVVSASVIAASCTIADGLATALMVLGPEKGIDLVNKMNQVECLIIVRKAEGELVDYYSKGFKDFFKKY